MQVDFAAAELLDLDGRDVEDPVGEISERASRRELLSDPGTRGSTGLRRARPQPDTVAPSISSDAVAWVSSSVSLIRSSTLRTTLC